MAHSSPLSRKHKDEQRHSKRGVSVTPYLRLGWFPVFRISRFTRRLDSLVGSVFHRARSGPHCRKSNNFSICAIAVDMPVANGLGAQAFWKTINQDRNSRLASVDLRASESLLRVLADATGTSLKRIRAAMLLSKTDSTQVLRRQRHRPDLRYCSVCFSEDKEPYFRRSWQSSCVLLCDRHSAWLSANCHSCAVTVRLIMISIEQSHLAICANCGQFLSTRMDPRPESPERQQLITMQKRLVSTFSKTHSSLG